ncbi:rhodanese-like domain-containing protein [Anoxybacillus ayderensis]|uniref:sulfurtransferase n=1 Tax=Anoxybacillus ayderensis TaxID=265546 RepID=UPI000A26A652|nr:sulfurtransferase [Anoxybacillus ayderensis]MED0657313.1 sulfurtransferase [Anoxybacillus ayderensis]OSX54826.1 sulfurtransferase [Anoxybacillus ayderensis]
MIYTVIALFVLYALYYRYVPVRGVKGLTSLSSYEHVTLLDVRDYNEKDEMNGALRIPVAYLKRHYQAIPNRQVIVIAKSHLEKNVAIRLLRRYHFSVQGYYIKEHEHANALKMVKCH